MPESEECHPEEVVARVLAGDVDAYGILVRRYQDLVLGIACQRLGDATEARDITQLTFLRAYEQLDEFRTGADFGTWLCVIARYMILTELERRKRQARNLGKHQTELRDLIEEGLLRDLDEEEEAAEKLAALRRCIGELQSKAATLVRLRYLEERSCREIASLENRTVTWVTTTLSRVRSTLRACLEQPREMSGS